MLLCLGFEGPFKNKMSKSFAAGRTLMVQQFTVRFSIVACVRRSGG